MATENAVSPVRLIAPPLLGAVATAIGGLVALDLVPADSAAGVVASSTCVVITGLAALFLVGGGRRRLGLPAFRLGPWWVVYYTVAFGITSYGLTEAQSGPASIIKRQYVSWACLLAAVGLASWVLGYAVGPPGLARRVCRSAIALVMPGEQWALRTPAFAAVVYAVGMLGRALQIQSTGLGYLADPSALVNQPSAFGQVFGALTTCAIFGLMLGTLALAQNPKSFRARATLICMLVIEIAFGLLSGTKSSVFLVMLTLVMVWVFVRGRISRSVAALGFVSLLLVPAVITEYRGRVRMQTYRVGSTRQAAGELVSVLGETLTPSGLVASIQSSPDSIIERLQLVSNLAILQQKTPSQIPYADPLEILAAPLLGVTPRAIWPGKPVLVSELEFSHTYYEIPEKVFTSSALTIPGDLYRHLGILGVILGLFLFGVFTRLAEAELYPGNDLRLVLLYGTIFVLFLKIESGVVLWLAALPQALLVGLVLTRLSFVPLRTLSRRGP